MFSLYLFANDDRFGDNETLTERDLVKTAWDDVRDGFFCQGAIDKGRTSRLECRRLVSVRICFLKKVQRISQMPVNYQRALNSGR